MHELCASNGFARIGGCSVFATLGMDVQWGGGTLARIIEAGVLRQTGEVPIEIYYNVVQGSGIDLRIALTDGDAPGRALLKMLNPSDSIVDWAVQAASTWHRGQGVESVLGLGIGGNPELAMRMARMALFEPHDIAQVMERGAHGWLEQLRVELMAACAVAGYPVKDVLIDAAPTHAGTKPVALMCGDLAASRFAHVVLTGNPVRSGADGAQRVTDPFPGCVREDG
ncbi:fumarate hydratase [Paraburkholderia lacunae]|nr:fumarate hydratase [Paraburkholderia lacunae]